MSTRVSKQGNKQSVKNATDKTTAPDAADATPAQSRQAKLRIMDKEVTIACREGEEDDLKQAAAYIDRSMRDLKSRNTTSSIEKIAIVTAINTADALLKSRARQGNDPLLLDRITAMNERLASLLDEPETAEQKTADTTSA